MSSALIHTNLACLLYSAGGCIIQRMLFWIDTEELSLEVPGFMSNVFSVLMQSCALESAGGSLAAGVGTLYCSIYALDESSVTQCLVDVGSR